MASESPTQTQESNDRLCDPLLEQGIPARTPSRSDTALRKNSGETHQGLLNMKPLDLQASDLTPVDIPDDSLLAEPFMVPFYKMPLTLLLKEIGKFLIFGASMSLNNAGNIIVIFMNFHYIGALQDPLLESSFGLGVSYFSFFFWSLCLGCFEITGIQCAKFYGKKDFVSMSTSLIHGFIFQSFVLVFSV
jgi:hypothetical protein